MAYKPCKTPKDVLDFIKKEGVKVVDFKVIDFPGLWQHFTIPAHRLTEEGFNEGYGFDGSSIRGWQTINESDMLKMPDPTTAILDPFTD
ncbi:glutamine synthetase beta-grasp domain-containing protein, partial [Candidatus Sumerlaeota bacterium]|nr:glutamine synthetase beta-grasp domain-containing protein [Candidatus Sumerlaeota bacterium]